MKKLSVVSLEIHIGRKFPCFCLPTDSFVSKNFCYEKLVKHHRELGVPWTDPAFPLSDAAKVRQLGRKVEWKRPSVLQLYSRSIQSVAVVLQGDR